MYERKFMMTVEENVFWAKRNLADYIWKSANLEGIAVTFPETQTVLEGVSVGGKRIDDLNRILQMKRGWQYLLSTLEEDVTMQYLQTLYQESISPTCFRGDPGHKDTCLSPVRNLEETEASLRRILDGDSGWTEKALDLMLYLAKERPFSDGNKRIAMMAANKVLISNGCGILSVSQDDLEQFFTLLVAYYEDESKKEELKLFLYDKCLDGFRKSIA